MSNFLLSKAGTWQPIEELLDKGDHSFVAFTRNRKMMVFNNYTVTNWVVDKYGLTHYMKPEPPAVKPKTRNI